MTIAGKRLYIRLVIAVVAIILLMLAAKMLFFPGKARALLDCAKAKAEARDMIGAIDDFTAVLKMPDATGEQKACALLNRGLARVEAGDTAGAMADFTAVLKIPDAETWAQFYTEQKAGAQFYTAGAIADFTAVLNMPETSAELKQEARHFLRMAQERLEMGSGKGE